jgi:hypothetical protein
MEKPGIDGRRRDALGFCHATLADQRPSTYRPDALRSVGRLAVSQSLREFCIMSATIDRCSPRSFGAFLVIGLRLSAGRRG